MRIHLAIYLTSACLASTQAFAQTDIEEIEQIFNDRQGEERLEAPPAESPQSSRLTTDSLSTVRNLEPFENFVAIQRRYLPKSRRFELNLGGGAMVNDPFFSNYSGSGRFAYSLNEAWAAELMGVYATGAERQVTENLRKQRGVTTDNLLTPRMFYGWAVRWSPFYGKQAWLNKKVWPFDHYFLLGGGITETNQNTNPFSYLVGTGQSYAINKSWAIRWDLLWLIYNTTSRTGGPTQFGLYNNVFLTAGVSFYFPDVSYR